MGGRKGWQEKGEWAVGQGLHESPDSGPANVGSESAQLELTLACTGEDAAYGLNFRPDVISILAQQYNRGRRDAQTHATKRLLLMSARLGRTVCQTGVWFLGRFSHVFFSCQRDSRDMP